MFALLGSFCLVRFDAASGAFSTADVSSLGTWPGARRSPIIPGDAVYLGAFDRDRERRWRFLGALESPELPMTPAG